MIKNYLFKKFVIFHLSLFVSQFIISLHRYIIIIVCSTINFNTLYLTASFKYINILTNSSPSLIFSFKKKLKIGTASFFRQPCLVNEFLTY